MNIFKTKKTYYINIVNTKGTNFCQATSHIFKTKQEAEKHKEELIFNASFQFIETIKFKTKRNYDNEETKNNKQAFKFK